MLNDKEDELEVIQNSLASEYCNNTFNMKDNEDDDIIWESI